MNGVRNSSPISVAFLLKALVLTSAILGIETELENPVINKEHHATQQKP